MQRDEASAFLDDKIKIDKENETLIDKFKCTYKIRLINNPNGYLYLTSYKVIFYNDKNQISVPLSDIVSVSKVNEYIEVKTKKKSYIVINKKKSFKQGHNHTKDFKYSKSLIDLAIRKKLPRKANKKVITSLIRISDDKNYIKNPPAPAAPS